MKKSLLVIASFFLLPFAAPESAEAGEYCREYQRNIVVGNQIQTGYGKACRRPNGDWEIISTTPGFDPYEIVPSDIRPRVVYSNVYYEPIPPRQVVVVPAYNYYYPRQYYHPRPHYSRPRSSSFVFNFGDNDRDRDRYRGRDWDHHSNGRGWGHHR